MPGAIHITTARKILEGHDPVDLDVWKADGSILHLKDCVSLRYDMHGGWRNVKVLTSGQMRRIRDVCIFRINDMDVYL